MKLRFLGHSGFQLTDGGHEVVIDPFMSHNPATPVEASEVAPSHILLSHAHGDHYGDTPAIAERTGATVVGPVEIANYVSQRGMQGQGMNIGGGFTFPFGEVRFTPAWHSSSFPDGTYGGMPTGIVVEIGGKRIYHAGDTALFSDMRLIGRKGLDLAMLPIGDFFTMGPDDALEAVKLLAPKAVIPIHYNTFEPIRQDAQAFKALVESETDARCLVLEPGDTTEL
jgi:L-ascorbate metabolism protein UlaG (beta-lactamase superfamily)